MTFTLSPDRQADRDDAWIRNEVAGDGIARTWLYIVGVALLAAGLVGFVDNPIVSRRGDALLQVDTLHSVVHLVTGLVALFIGASQHGRALGEATIAFGGMYLVIFAATLVSPDLLGIFATPVNTADHGLQLVVAAGSVAAGLGSTWRRLAT
jgi:hypothetical protein